MPYVLDFFSSDIALPPILAWIVIGVLLATLAIVAVVSFKNGKE